MKSTFIYAAALCLLSSIAVAQNNAPFTVSGKNIIDPCGDTFIPKGVNYSLLDDWNFPANLNNGELSSQIIQANPNTVRIQWYADYGQPTRPAYSLSDLDSVVSRFERANIVSVVELHDLTGSKDYNEFNTRILSWWLQTDVLQFINKHKSHLIVNLANEFGPVASDTNYNAEIADWITNYDNAITSMRSAGVTVPLMIDAANYGLDLDMALNNGAALENYDPLHNIIISVHGYWDNTLQTMSIMVGNISTATFPIMLGEVGNADANCATLFWYNYLLQDCQDDHVGWLAWTWNRDECSMRNMTNNSAGAPEGQFNTLTPYGNTIVNDTSFGLATHAVKACFNSPVVTGINEIAASDWKCYPNPVIDYINVASLHNTPIDVISIRNVNGQKMNSIQVNKNAISGSVYTGNLAAGIYFIEFSDKEGNSYRKKFIKE